jgi:hypothetical protein
MRAFSFVVETTLECGGPYNTVAKLSEIRDGRIFPVAARLAARSVRT